MSDDLDWYQIAYHEFDADIPRMGAEIVRLREALSEHQKSLKSGGK